MISHCCPKPKFKNVTHVIFDLDGTILDTEGIHFDAIKAIVEEYNKVMGEDIFTKIGGRREIDAFAMAISLLGLPLSTEEFAMKFRNITEGQIPDAVFLPGAERMIRHLHSNGILMAVATSSTSRSVVLKTKNKKEVFDLFSHIVCGSDDPEVKRGKPFPDIFLICASRFPDHPDPSKCLVFEDSPNGVESALAAGMQVVMIPNDNVPYDMWKNATLRLDSFDFMLLSAFGLPPFPTEEKYSNSSMRDDRNSLVGKEKTTALSEEGNPSE